MWFELGKEDIKLVSQSLEDEEINCLPLVQQIMFKIIGVVNKEPGRSDLVDTFRSVVVTIEKLISETTDYNE